MPTLAWNTCPDFLAGAPDTEARELLAIAGYGLLQRNPFFQAHETTSTMVHPASGACSCGHDLVYCSHNRAPSAGLRSPPRVLQIVYCTNINILGSLGAPLRWS